MNDHTQHAPIEHDGDGFTIKHMQQMVVQSLDDGIDHSGDNHMMLDVDAHVHALGDSSMLYMHASGRVFRVTIHDAPSFCVCCMGHANMMTPIIDNICMNDDGDIICDACACDNHPHDDHHVLYSCDDHASSYVEGVVS
jgi:hypothetical protein